MASIETTEFENGQWRTRRRPIQNFLKNDSAEASHLPAQDQPPTYGIMSKTVVDSPIAHWTLPARLRSARHNDVVFAGDRYIQVSELREGGELHEVIRKNDFDSRIVNACVIGNTHERLDEEYDEYAFARVKRETPDIDMADGTTLDPGGVSSLLPPHLLLLTLDSGVFVFLFIRQDAGFPEFVSYVFRHAGAGLGSLGYHVAVDPKSRYVAVADVDNKLAVYELRTWQSMNEHYQKYGNVEPIAFYSAIAIQGLIHKVVFLHPRPQDEDHVILLLIIVGRKGSAMVLYDWAKGESLPQVLSVPKPGHLLPHEHRMPMLVIPLTLRSSFLAVSEGFIGFCKDPLQGPPHFESVYPGSHDTSPYHHGRKDPLWTAWDRPVRRPGYYDSNDNIYLAREDGVIMYLELNQDDIVSAAMNVGTCHCNISTAFTTMYDAFNDVAVIAGDSGPGMICQLRPREPLVELGTVPNWTPVPDFVTFDGSATWKPNGSVAEKQDWRSPVSSDRIFCISGKGVQGSLTELRHGVAANIGWEMSYGSHIQRVWFFDASLPEVGSGYYVLLTLPASSDVFFIPRNSAEAVQPGSDAAQFDTSSRTLTSIQCSEQVIAQITETSITLVTPTQSAKHTYDRFPEAQGDTIHATARGNFVATAAYWKNQFYVHIFYIEQLDVSHRHTLVVQGEVTALTFSSIDSQDMLLVSYTKSDHPYLGLYGPLHGLVHVSGIKPQEIEAIRLDYDASPPEVGERSDESGNVEHITSIATVEEAPSETCVALGSRSGHLITVLFAQGSASRYAVWREKFGSLNLEVMPTENHLLPGSVLVCCDDSLLLLRGFGSRRPGSFQTKERVIVNDVKEPQAASPPIHYATSMKYGVGQSDRVSLILLTSNRILVTEMFPASRVVPRSFSLGHTPTKLVFSPSLRCLVVALRLRSGGTTIVFIDPDTGKDLSQPYRGETPTEVIKGLGANEGKIQDMIEWRYVKSGATWVFLVLATKTSVIIVATQPVSETNAEGKEERAIRYRTRYIKATDAPVYAIAGSAEDVLYCAGKTLHWEVLDLTEKRFRTKRTTELPSPATSIRIANDKAYILTDQHSLVVLDLSPVSPLPPGSPPPDMGIRRVENGRRDASHFIGMGGEEGGADGTTPWKFSLVCEKLGSFAGLWMASGQAGEELKSVFSGNVPAAIRRLQKFNARPAARPMRRRLADPSTQPSSSQDGDAGAEEGAGGSDGLDVLGMAMNGSMYHFAILEEPVWKFLDLVQRMCFGSRQVCPFRRRVWRLPAEDEEWEEDEGGHDGEGPRRYTCSTRHIEGDVLQRCLDQRALRELVEGCEGAEELFGRRIDELAREGYIVPSPGEGGTDPRDLGQYVELGYDVLEMVLRPLL